jgi:hypothetical protein
VSSRHELTKLIENHLLFSNSERLKDGTVSAIIFSAYSIAYVSSPRRSSLLSWASTHPLPHHWGEGLQPAVLTTRELLIQLGPQLALLLVPQLQARSRTWFRTGRDCRVGAHPRILTHASVDASLRHEGFTPPICHRGLSRHPLIEGVRSLD